MNNHHIFTKPIYILGAFLLLSVFLFSGFVSAAAQLSTTASWVEGSSAEASLYGGIITLNAVGAPSEAPWVASEARIVIPANDVGISTLNDLNSISWDANVLSGYLPHLDVILDFDGDGIKDDALVFEYAKVDPTNCDNDPYPTDELNTFADKGIIDDGAYAWLSSGPAGDCSTLEFLANYHSLGDWISTGSSEIDENTAVLRLELEVDAWISDSESEVSNIIINGKNYYLVTISNSDDFTIDSTTFEPQLGEELVRNSITHYSVNSISNIDATIPNVQWKITIEGPGGSVLDSSMIDLDEAGWKDVLNEPSTTAFHYPITTGSSSNELVTFGSCSLPIGTFSLEATGTQGNESRVTILASDVGINTLNDFNTMSWDALVNLGYLPHVDVIIDTNNDGVGDDALVFEYAKEQAPYDNAPYPTGSLNTFGDKGTLDDTSRAWLSSHAPGDFSAPDFIDGLLSEWKDGTADDPTINGNTRVLRLELEVDNWIADSNSEVSNIQVNGNSYVNHDNECTTDFWEVDPMDDFTNIDSIQFATSTPEGTYTITRQLVDGDGNAISNELIIAEVTIPGEGVGLEFDEDDEGGPAIDTGLDLEIEIEDLGEGVTTADIDVIRYDGGEISVSIPSGFIVGGSFFDITSDLGDGTFNVTLTFTYDDANVNEAGLDVYFFNEGTSGWTLVSGTKDFDANTITVTIDHFSLWGLFENRGTAGGGGGGGRATPVPTTAEQPPAPTATTPTETIPTPPAPTQGFFAAITGAIVGALGAGGASTVVLVFMIIVVVGAIVVIVLSRRGVNVKSSSKKE